MENCPEKSSSINFGLIFKAKEEMSFTQKEFDDFKIITDEKGNITWDPASNSKEKDIKFPKVVSDIFCKVLKAIDEKEELNIRQLSLHKKFVLENTDIKDSDEEQKPVVEEQKKQDK